MRLRIALAILLCVLNRSAAGATLRGVILRDHLGGTPVPGVQVNAPGEANPVVSGTDGSFVLSFRTLQPGQPAQLVVSKPGFAVVNDFQLWLNLPSDASTQPVALLLSLDRDREEMARRFYRLKSVESIEVSYERRLRELDKEKKDTTQERERLRIERDQAIANAENAAKELAKVRAADVSALYRSAMELFTQGKTDEALAILNDEKVKQAVEALEKQRQETVRLLTLRAQLLINKFQFDEASATYKQAIGLAPDDAGVVFSYAYFCQQQHRFADARTYYQRALDLFRQQKNEEQSAAVLNNLGNLDRAQQRYEEARKEYEEALGTYRKLAELNPQVYLPYVAITLNNLGILDLDQDRKDEAKAEFQESLGIYQSFAKASPVYRSRAEALQMVLALLSSPP